MQAEIKRFEHQYVVTPGSPEDYLFHKLTKNYGIGRTESVHPSDPTRMCLKLESFGEEHMEMFEVALIKAKSTFLFAELVYAHDGNVISWEPNQKMYLDDFMFLMGYSLVRNFEIRLSQAQDEETKAFLREDIAATRVAFSRQFDKSDMLKFLDNIADRPEDVDLQS